MFILVSVVVVWESGEIVDRLGPFFRKLCLEVFFFFLEMAPSVTIRVNRHGAI